MELLANPAVLQTGLAVAGLVAGYFVRHWQGGDAKPASIPVPKTGKPILDLLLARAMPHMEKLADKMLHDFAEKLGEKIESK